MFDSLLNMSITMVLVGMAMLWLITGKEPWKVLWFSVKELITNHPFRMAFLLMITVIMINKLELAMERAQIHGFVPWDITPLVYTIEGNLGVALQQWANPWATSFFTFVYIFGYPAMIGASLLGYNYIRKRRLMRMLFYAFTLNYLLALPFYLFFPVTEVWSFNSQVKPLIDNFYPAYHTQYRLMSGLDNCFPSLHTSVSVTMALLAWVSGRRAWAWLAGGVAFFTVLSTLYLGIHWVTDVTAGLGLAYTAFVLAGFLVEVDYRVLAVKRSLVSWVRNLPFF